MDYFIKKFKKENVSLTGYIHGLSDELQNADKRPAILIFPGGGFFMCSDREAEPVALAYMAEGYNTFILRYSVGEHVPFSESYEDAVEAITYLNTHGDELHIDIEKIAVAGFSAGGHLAAVLSVMCEVKPRAMILGYPSIMASMGNLLNKELPGADEHVTEQTPPAFIFSTSNDTVVPVKNSLRLAEALDEHGIEFELHIYRKGEHGLSLAKPLTANGKKNMVNPAVAEWFQDSVAWLKDIWGDFYAEGFDELEMEHKGISIDVPLRSLLEHNEGKQVILEYLPDIETMLQASPMAGNYSLRIMNYYSPEIVTDSMLADIRVKLEEIEN